MLFKDLKKFLAHVVEHHGLYSPALDVSVFFDYKEMAFVVRSHCLVSANKRDYLTQDFAQSAIEFDDWTTLSSKVEEKHFHAYSPNAECIVPSFSDCVDLLLRNGTVIKMVMAKQVDWRWNNTLDDIVAFRFNFTIGQPVLCWTSVDAYNENLNPAIKSFHIQLEKEFGFMLPFNYHIQTVFKENQ